MDQITLHETMVRHIEKTIGRQLTPDEREAYITGITGTPVIELTPESELTELIVLTPECEVKSP